jgi:hypothetical protein
MGRLPAGWIFEVCFASHKMSSGTYQSIIKYFNENKIKLSSIGMGRSVSRQDIFRIIR